MIQASDAEMDFFAATDVAERAAQFWELDPRRNHEVLLYPLTALLATIAIVLVAVGFHADPQGPKVTKSATPAAAATVADDRPQADSPARPTVAVTKTTPAPMLRRRSQPTAAAPTPALAPVDLAPKTEETSDSSSWLARTLRRQAAKAHHKPAPATETTDDANHQLAQAQEDLQAGRHSAIISQLAGQTTNGATLEVLGRAYYESGQDSQALLILEKAHQRGHRGVHTLLLLGDLLRTRDTDGSREVYQAFLNRHPASPHATEVRAILRNM